MKIENLDILAKTVNTLSNKKRISAFLMLAEGKSPNKIVEIGEMSNSGLQKFLGDFRDSRLVEKEGKSYKLTPKGEFVREWLRDFDERYDEDFAKEELKEIMEERGIGYASPKGREILKRLLEEAEKEE